MAEACSLLAGSTSLHVIENVRAFDWIALDDGASTLEVRAEVVDASPEPLSRDDPRRRGAGRQRRFPVRAVAGTPALWRRSAPARPSVWSGPELYTTGMFHGPVFQSVRQIAGWNEQGIDADLSEVALQDFFAIGQHAAAGPESGPARRRRPGRGVLDCPAGGRRLQLLPVDDRAHRAVRTVPGRPRRASRCAARQRAARRRRHRRLRAAGLGLRVPRRLRRAAVAGRATWSTSSSRCRTPSTRCGAIPCAACSARRARPGRASACRCGRCRTTPRTSAPSRTRSSCASWRMPCSATRSGPNGARCRARCGAGASGCSAARPIKEAVRMTVFQQTGKLLYPSDITVLHDELGAPFVDGWWRGELAEAPQVSLSHTARACLVARRRGRVAGRRRLRGPRPDPAARAHDRHAHRRRARHGRRPGRRRARRASASPLVRQGSGGQVPGHRPAGPARGVRGRLRRRQPAPARRSSSKARRPRSASSATARR